MSRTAQVKRDARMGEAEARRDAGIRVSLATIYTVCSMARCIELSLCVDFVFVEMHVLR